MLGLVLAAAKGDDMSPTCADPTAGAKGDRRHQPRIEVLQGSELSHELGAGEIAAAALQPLDQNSCRSQGSHLRRDMSAWNAVGSLQGMKSLRAVWRLVAAEKRIGNEDIGTRISKPGQGLSRHGQAGRQDRRPPSRPRRLLCKGRELRR